jgi:regulator of sigma E protease
MSEEERSISFHHKKVGPRAAIVAAGPIANFILAIVIFAAMALYYGKPSSIPRVDALTPDSVAVAAGFKVGDVIDSIDGSSIESFADMQRVVSTNAGSALAFRVKREGGIVNLTATPALKEVKDLFGNTHRIGQLGIQYNARAEDRNTTPVGFIEAVKIGGEQTWFIITGTFKFIGSLFAGAGSAGDVGGPLRIAQMSGQAASLGFQFVLQLCAALSVSIGLLNLFPVPLLDGGHLLFYGVEAIRGRPLSDRAQEMGFRIGLGLVLMLMVFATYNDILHLAGS